MKFVHLHRMLWQQSTHIRPTISSSHAQNFCCNLFWSPGQTQHCHLRALLPLLPANGPRQVRLFKITSSYTCRCCSILVHHFENLTCALIAWSLSRAAVDAPYKGRQHRLQFLFLGGSISLIAQPEIVHDRGEGNSVAKKKDEKSSASCMESTLQQFCTMREVSKNTGKEPFSLYKVTNHVTCLKWTWHHLQGNLAVSDASKSRFWICLWLLWAWNIASTWIRARRSHWQLSTQPLNVA